MKIYNFSAGPACLPDSVLEASSRATLNYKETGVSLMEMSHRSSEVMELFSNSTKRVKRILDVPSNYHVLWLQGGASTQFSMAPLNLLPDDGIADYIETGSWSTKAIHECKKIAHPNVIGSSKDKNFTYIPKNLPQNINSHYLHITSNNTIYGTQYNKMPEVLNSSGYLVADMSSDLFSKPVDISKFGLIYAGAQKNMGPAGVTLIIIRDDLVGLNYRDMPTMLNYETHVKKDSMFNTPPVFSVFVVNETLKWLEKIGGMEKIDIINRKKAEKLYSEIESNKLFESPIRSEDQSLMNVPFIFSNRSHKDQSFLDFCSLRGLKTLKGHRSVGGFRASIYNAMEERGVDALIDAMQSYKVS